MNVFEKADKLVADATVVLEGASVMKSEIEAYGKSQYDKGWDEAMVQAGSGGSTDKIYSEAEMNQIIAETKAPLEAKIAEVQAQLDGVPAQIAAATEAAVNGFKAMLKSKYAEQQVAESQGETGFGSLLD